MITSVYAKSSNSFGFNLILQKFYEIIWEILVPKRCAEFSRFFCRSCFINLLWRTNFGTVKSPKVKISRDRSIIFKKFPHTVLNILSAQIRLKHFFQRNYFSWTPSFFHEWKTNNLDLIFLRKTIISYLFLKNGFHCVKNGQIRSSSGPQDYDQKRKLFRNNSFVLAHSSAKKIYSKQLMLKSSI